MAIVAGLPLAFVISLLLSRITIVAFGVIVILCVLAPIIAFGLSAALGLTGAARQAAIIEASMPAAVITTVLALEFDLALLFLTGKLQTSGANEFHYLAQLRSVEPGTMAFANIDDHAGASRKIDPVHELPAVRTGHIANALQIRLQIQLVPRRE